MSIQLIIIQAVTFIGIIVILRMVFQSQLNSALERLNKLHEENLIKEEELTKQLEEAKAEKEAAIAKAREEAAAIVKEARARAEQGAVDLGTRAKAEAQTKFDHAKGEIDKLKNEVMTTSHEKAVELSVKMIEALFTSQGKEALQHDLEEEIFQEIKGIDKDKFTVKAKEVNVISAMPLSPEDKTKLEHILSEKMGSRAEINGSVDKSIIAGFIIKIGALTIDASLKNKLHKLLPQLK